MPFAKNLKPALGEKNPKNWEHIEHEKDRDSIKRALTEQKIYVKALTNQKKFSYCLSDNLI